MSGFRKVFRSLVSGPAARHPLRIVLPALGVAIGVAAVAAIHHANRSATESFRDAADAVSGRSDLVVTGVRGVPLAALARLSFLWESGSFAPAVTGPAVLAGRGEVVEILGVDYGGDRAIRRMTLVPEAGAARGRRTTLGSVFVPRGLAGRLSVSPGDRLDVIAGGRPVSLPVGALLELSGVARAAGGDLLVTDLFTAQRLLGSEGYVDRVDVALDRRKEAAAIARRIAAVLPAGVFVEPPGRAAETANRMVRAFRFNLNALGSLTLLVGVFLIANAVSISVLRRRPEIATLRAIGASRGTIFAVFLAEGLAIGLLGTVAGELGGRLLSGAALESVRSTVTEVYLPTAKVTPASWTGPALLAGAVGIAAAVLATILPALEATRVAPSPALRAGSVEGARRRRLPARAAAAGAALLLAVAAAGAPPVRGFPFYGFAAVSLVVAALALAAPLLVRAAGHLAGRPLASSFGVAGRLGSRFFSGSLARNGLAVAALAMALAMTLAMIVTVASIRQTVRVWVETSLRADLWIKAHTGGRSGVIGDLPEEVLTFLRDTPGVAGVDPFRAREARDARGRAFTVGSGDFAVLSRQGGLSLVDGRDAREVALAARERGEALVSEPYARRFGAWTGARVTLFTPAGARAFRVAGVYRDFSNDRGTVVLDRALYVSLFDDRRLTSAAVVAAPGEDPAALRRRILAASPFALTVTTNRELRAQVLDIFDRTFAVTRALEAIAVAVAVLGIANALAASAIERRRSFALLRAIGASGSHIRGAVLVEGLLIGTSAAAAAIVCGTAFAWLLLAVINPQSFGWSVVLHVPPGPLAGALGLVTAASLAAAILPARFAASVDPAAALAEE
ncbi:MAG: FtsX-like permease family protein [Thermoanaerobaculia bacterium]